MMFEHLHRVNWGLKQAPSSMLSAYCHNSQQGMRMITRVEAHWCARLEKQHDRPRGVEVVTDARATFRVESEQLSKSMIKPRSFRCLKNACHCVRYT